MDVDARSGMEILSEEECWRLLGQTAVGRLAVAPGGRPDIYPINYLATNGTLIFRTAEGSKLTSVVINHAVALEIDEYEPDSNQAWSVVVSGTAKAVTSDDDAAALESLPLSPWHTGPKHHFVEIAPIKVTGRRFVAEGRARDDDTTSQTRRSPTGE
jgi:nitroimidazol reductase NimA-like FMN-containing flavoprotein (pyridoxamine 5'-phosphate oxidase superfamily)